MALKLLLFLALLNVAFTVPAPDPDPDIRIDVQQIVNVGGCCPERTCGNQKTCTYMGQNGACSIEEQPPFINNVGRQECEDDCECYIGGCVFGDTTYSHRDVIEDTCLKLMCVNGDWNYIGQQTNSKCGECIVHGEPHIAIYSSYSPINDVRTFAGVGTYAISQPGFEDQPSYGVSSNFVECHGPYSCVQTASYVEPDINITMILPSLSMTDYCNNLTVTNPQTDPLCMIKVLVNNEERTLGKSVKSFIGTDGNVLVFKHNHISSSEDLNCINVVGSKGFSVSLCQCAYDYAWLYVWAMPSLQNQIYGLCSRFPGDDYEYTTRSNTTTHNYTVSADSWEIGENSVSIINMNLADRCTDPAEKGKIEEKCNKTTLSCPIHTKGFYDSCVYDLCRVSNPDRYLEGYASHVLVHRQISVSAPTCSCKYERAIVGGCVITEAVPSDTACRCHLSVGIPIYPPFCWGTVVPCKNNSSSYCGHPDTSYDSCMQGEGNCAGYLF